MKDRDRLTPSLLEPQSRGGDVAEEGFSFQDHVILAHIPVWLAQEGFTAMLREGIGDVEAKFFVPGRGFIIQLLEVKDHILQPSKFWSEVQRFREVDAGSPGTYQRFTLIGAGASRELQPLLNGLRRLRDPHGFYEDSFVVNKNSFQDYIRLVEGMGKTEQEARFIFEKVFVEVDWNTAKPYGSALFQQSLVENLAEYSELSHKILDNLYVHLSSFIRQRRNQLITRKELEAKIQDKIPPNQLPPSRPILIYTAIAPEDNPMHPGLRFDWTAFSGGESRAIVPSSQWNQKLMAELQATRSLIENHRHTKRIRLVGNRRLSACLAIGSVFSAVRGYTIDMEYRGELWSTDTYSTNETAEYSLAHQTVGEAGENLIITIGIFRDIVPEVEMNLEKFGLTNMPMLHIQGDRPIISSQQTNLVAGQIKALIIKHLQWAGSKRIHLFIAGPAHLALFLGHRLDGTAPINCYAWISNSRYAPTCQLFSG